MNSNPRRGVLAVGLLAGAFACAPERTLVAEDGTAAIISQVDAAQPCLGEVVEVRGFDATQAARAAQATAADKECADCSGTTIRMRLTTPSTGSSTISAADCLAQLQGRANTFCADQGLPSDCSGECDKGTCQAYGSPSSVDIHIQPSGTSTCSMSRAFCSCGCR